MLEQTIIDQSKTVNLVDLIGRDTHLRHVAGTNGGEYAGPCPFCGGRDRLRVQPERGRWWCRQCSPDEHWSDAIGYVEKRDSVDFAEAVRRLAGNALSTDSCPKSKTVHAEHSSRPQSALWQARAREWTQECQDALWTDAGANAREWLRNRGLNDDTLRQWHLGYSAADRWEDERPWGFVDKKRIGLPRGIVVPCIVADGVWYVKIRRPRNDPKYIHVRGSRPALFGADTLGHHDYAVLTEGEFDAMLTWQCLHHATNPEWHQIGVATLGSATNPLDVDTWAHYLLPVGRFLVCYDSDTDGAKGADRWSALTARARRVVVPTIKPNDKDLTDFHRSGGRILDLITFEIGRDQWQQEHAATSEPAVEVAAQEDGHHSVNGGLDDLTHQRDVLAQQLDSLGEAVASMRHALGEELTEAEREERSPVYARKLAEWLEVNESYKRVCDRIDVLELTAHLAGTNTSETA